MIVFTLADEEYLSMPTPAATPKMMRLLLTVRRYDIVDRSRSFTCNVSVDEEPLVVVAVIVVVGRPRLITLTATPGTTSDSCNRPTRTPPPILMLELGATLKASKSTLGT